jgi:2-keto-4-pentenoate hydratase/2-oxohepta-3-ene-1,7-dioic acid hydratase in catechol pathway
MIELIQAGEAGLNDVRKAMTDGHALQEYRLLTPIPAPGKLLFSSVNYRSHLEENPSATLPTYPQFFSKLPSAVIGPDEPILVPEPYSKVDYEVELAIVIGKRAQRVTQAQAREYIFGYTIVNDVSGRDVQFTDNQITLGKGFDTFCPMGPEIVLQDEIPDPMQLHVASYVNGERMQYSSTSEMLFSVDKILEFLAAHVTLYPGDIVTTGTPAGVGCFRNPPVYLKAGDVVTVEVDKIGRLTNPVEARW